MKIEFSRDLFDTFEKTSFFDEDAKLIDLNNGGKTINIYPDDDGYVYIPELAMLYPTSLTKNGDDEMAEYDYAFIVKLINEFRKQAI